jgi:hypothetical protein
VRIAARSRHVAAQPGLRRRRRARPHHRQAREPGISLFDTAQANGFVASEALLGRAPRDELRHNRGDVVIATKGGMRLERTGLKWHSTAEWLRCSV